jgi:hypothetical protein
VTAVTRQPDPCLANVIDLDAHRQRRHRPATGESAWSSRPVLYITPEFVAALQGAWGELPTFVPRQAAAGS